MKKVIICDWNRTLFDLVRRRLYKDTEPFLGSCGDCRLVLISYGEVSWESTSWQLINRCFDKVMVQKKTLSQFLSLKKEFRGSQFWVIGDKLDSEIYLGNRCGFRTIRVLRGKFRNEKAKNVWEKPEFEIRNLMGAKAIILGRRRAP